VASDVKPGRWTARIDGDFVVLLTGARFNSKWQAVRACADLGGRRGMDIRSSTSPSTPDKGLLGYKSAGFTVIRYWRSFEHLEAFARDDSDPHLAAWRTYWKRVGRSARTGIWHKSYLVRNGEHEAIYGNMPPHGLGKASSLLSLAEASSARNRLRTGGRA